MAGPRWGSLTGFNIKLSPSFSPRTSSVRSCQFGAPPRLQHGTSRFVDLAHCSRTHLPPQPGVMPVDHQAQQCIGRKTACPTREACPTKKSVSPLNATNKSDMCSFGSFPIAEKLSPFAFYQHLLTNVADAEAGDFLRMLTFLPLPEIAQIEHAASAPGGAGGAQRRLAEEVRQLKRPRTGTSPTSFASSDPF